MLTRWTVFQSFIIITLIALAMFVDQFSQQIAIPFSPNQNSTVMPILMTLLFITVVTGLFNLMFYFQTKKSGTFLDHPLWEKMPFIIPVLLGVTLIVLMSLFMMTPLQDQRWFVYVIIYLFLYMMSLFVLSVVHKTKPDLKVVSKIKYSGVSTVFVLFVIIFFI